MNWVETIALIQRAGYSQSQIAAHCRCAQSSINDIATGKTADPRHSIGEGLRSLEAKAKRKMAAKQAENA